MKTKRFQKYLARRLTKTAIAEIKLQAKLEKESLCSLQSDINTAICFYMKREKIGFNELARRLDFSPTQVAKIQKGKANLTLASIAHIFAVIKQRPHLIFK